MKKIEQILCFLTCLMIIVAAALQQKGTLLGHSLATSATETVAQTPDSVAVDAANVVSERDGMTIINTTSIGKDIMGYAGPVPLEVCLKDGKVSEVIALDNSETPDFFDEAKTLLSAWNGKTTSEALTLKVDAVSGATFSSKAIIGNVQLALQYAQSSVSKPSLFERMDLTPKYAIGLIVVLMGAIIPLFFKGKRYRLLQLLLNVVVLGFWCGTFISYSLIVNFMSNGINIWTQLIPIIMLIAAFIYPLFGKKNHYCANICPFGSLQELAGRCTKKKWKLSSATAKRLTLFRQILWAVLMILMLGGIFSAWMDYELFTAFIFRSANIVVIIVAIITVLLSFFVQRPYCRFVCPTGTLMKLSQNIK